MKYKRDHLARVLKSDAQVWEKMTYAPFAFSLIPLPIEKRVAEEMKALCEREGHQATNFNCYRKPFSEEYHEKVRNDILGALHRGEATEKEVVSIVRRNANMVHQVLMSLLEEGIAYRHRNGTGWGAQIPYRWGLVEQRKAG